MCQRGCGGKSCEPDFSYSQRSFLSDPMGSMKTLMGMDPNHRASDAVFPLCSSSQQILLPSYSGALVNLFCILPVKEGTQGYCDWREEWEKVSLAQEQLGLSSAELTSLPAAALSARPAYTKDTL